jgi:hypothetical protein
MKPNMLVWLAVFMGLVLALSVTALRGWAAGAVVACAVFLAIPLSVKRFRHERNLVRTFRRGLKTR